MVSGWRSIRGDGNGTIWEMMDETIRHIKGNPFRNLHPAEIPTRVHEYKWTRMESNKLKDEKNMDETMKRIKEGKGLLPLNERKTLNLAMNYGDDVSERSIVACNKNWIPVKNRKPKEEEIVLVSIEDLNGFDSIKQTVRVGKWSSVLVGSSLDSYRHEWKICGENGENCYRRVTAWKPLDEPYMPES